MRKIKVVYEEALIELHYRIKMARKKKSYILIKQVTKFSGDRLHVEIPSERRPDFKPGDYVAVKKTDPGKIKF